MYLIKDFWCVLIINKMGGRHTGILNLWSLFKNNGILYFKNKTQVVYAEKIYFLRKNFSLDPFFTKELLHSLALSSSRISLVEIALPT